MVHKKLSYFQMYLKTRTLVGGSIKEFELLDVKLTKNIIGPTF